MNRSLFANRHPYWFTAILEAVARFVYILAGTVAHFTQLPNLMLYGLADGQPIFYFHGTPARKTLRDCTLVPYWSYCSFIQGG